MLGMPLSNIPENSRTMFRAISETAINFVPIPHQNSFKWKLKPANQIIIFNIKYSNVIQSKTILIWYLYAKEWL